MTPLSRMVSEMDSGPIRIYSHLFANVHYPDDPTTREANEKPRRKSGLFVLLRIYSHLFVVLLKCPP